MDTQKVLDKMPGFVKEAWGQTQKNLHRFEGEAKKMFAGTLTKIRGLDLQPVLKRVTTLGNSMSKKAFTTIGVATKTDIRSLLGKIEKLRGEVKRLAGLGKSDRS